MFSLGNGTVADVLRLPLLVCHHWENVQSRRNFSLGGLTIAMFVFGRLSFSLNIKHLLDSKQRLENSPRKIWPTMMFK